MQVQILELNVYVYICNVFDCGILYKEFDLALTLHCNLPVHDLLPHHVCDMTQFIAFASCVIGWFIISWKWILLNCFQCYLPITLSITNLSCNFVCILVSLPEILADSGALFFTNTGLLEFLLALCHIYVERDKLHSNLSRIYITTRCLALGNKYIFHGQCL